MRVKDSVKKSVKIGKEKITTGVWSIKTAFKINRRILLLWSLLSILLSVLPTVALYYNKLVIKNLTQYIEHQTGTYGDFLPAIITLGAIEIFIGVSNRVNFGLVYTMMYDYYYIGIQSLLMKAIQKIDITDLMKPEINDDYNFSISRAGSLTNAMSGLCITLGKLISVVSFMIVALSYSKLIFTAILLFVLLVLGIDIIYSDKVRHNRNKVAQDERYAMYLEKLPQTPGAAKEIRIYNMTDLVIKQWRSHYRTIIEDKKRRAFYVFQQNLLSSLGYYLLNILITLFTMYMIAQNRLTIDEFLMIYLLGNNLYSAITELTKSLISLDYGLYALEKQRQFFLFVDQYQSSRQSEVQYEIEEKEELVYHIKNLKFAYNDNSGYFIDVPELKIRKGEVIALIGENGSGKSTFVKLLLGLYQPQEGVILFYGRPLNSYSTEEICKKAGTFFQDSYIFHHTMQENVGYGDIRYVDDADRVHTAIELGQAENVLKKLPDGLQTLLGKDIDKSGIELSGGEKQRVALARAYMCEREVLVLDEPAAMLDPIAEQNQFNHLKHYFAGHTVILISHRIGFARMSDKIVLLDKGRIVEYGSHEELMKKHGRYEEFFHEQAQWYEKTE